LNTFRFFLFFSGIALVVDLCLMYEVFKPTLWAKLLSRLLKLGQGLGPLKHALLALNRAPSLWHLTEFHEGWKKLIFEPFTKASDPPTKECIEECSTSVALLQSCPIASEVGVAKLRNECLKLGMTYLAESLEQISTSV
jgi:hypothetical protein